jgi:hypothetical protein
MGSRTASIIVLGAIIFCAIGLCIYGRVAATRASIVIEWSTASELDTAGFNIYRSEAPKGDAILVNDKVVSASTEPWIGGNYKYIDNNVTPGTIYYYWLEDIGMSGNVNRHGPIEVEAKAGGKVETWVAVWLLIIAGIGIGAIIYSKWFTAGKEHA